MASAEGKRMRKLLMRDDNYQFMQFNDAFCLLFLAKNGIAGLW